MPGSVRKHQDFKGTVDHSMMEETATSKIYDGCRQIYSGSAPSDSQ
jgi:hypothetical protein